MTSDDGLVEELAARMHRADRADHDEPAGGAAPAGGEPGEDAAQAPLTVDLETYAAAHEVSQWTDDEPPRTRRRRTG